MKRIGARRLLSAACVPAMGLLLAVPLGGVFAGTASADSTCYTGCSTPSTGSNQPTDPYRTASTSAPSTSSGLAFTGADIEEMAAIGVVAIGVGTVLVRGRRRQSA